MANKKRVLIDTFHLYNALTGIRTYTTQLCEGIESMKEELSAEYIIYPDWRKLDQSTFLKGKLNPLKKIVNHLSMFLWKQVALPYIIWTKKIDVVFAPDFVVPAIQIRAIRMPVIHDTFFWDFESNYPSLWRKYYTGMIQMGLKKNTIIIATSKYTAQNIRRAITNKHSIEVVYQSPKLLARNRLKKAALKKYNLDEVPYYLHVGLFDRRKNIQLLVKAFAQLTKVSENYEAYKLVLVGEKGLGKNHDDFDDVKRLIKELKIGDKVVLTGFVSNEELETLYSNAFAYVFPSLDEGFGIPVLEAMNFQIPLIVSDKGSLQEIAGPGALVFKATSVDDLVLKMLEVQQDEIRERLKQEGSLRVKQFTKASFVRQVDQVVMKYAK